IDCSRVVKVYRLYEEHSFDKASSKEEQNSMIFWRAMLWGGVKDFVNRSFILISGMEQDEISDPGKVQLDFFRIWRVQGKEVYGEI
ncbi:MAG: hypothetical protein ACOCWA_06320, partial [Bacteroidota bacterium]